MDTLTTTTALQFCAVYTLLILGLGFYLGRKWRAREAKHLRAMLEIERSWKGAR